jgi:hypothetical protein
MWQGVQGNWIPKDYYTEREFECLKKSNMPSAERGYVGFTFSFGGDKFAGHKTRYQNESKTRSAALNNKAKIPRLRTITRGVQFTQRSYEELVPKNQIVYCDPPYKDTGGNSVNLRGFEHDSFWSTMRDWSRDNLVFVSEQEHEGNFPAPPDWKCIFREPVRRKMTTHGSQQVMDCLFVYQTWVPNVTPKVISVSSSQVPKPQASRTTSQPAMSALQKQTLQRLKALTDYEAKLAAQVQKYKNEYEAKLSAQVQKYKNEYEKYEIKVSNLLKHNDELKAKIEELKDDIKTRDAYDHLIDQAFPDDIKFPPEPPAVVHANEALAQALQIEDAEDTKSLRKTTATPALPPPADRNEVPSTDSDGSDENSDNDDPELKAQSIDVTSPGYREWIVPNVRVAQLPEGKPREFIQAIIQVFQGDSDLHNHVYRQCDFFRVYGIHGHGDGADTSAQVRDAFHWDKVIRKTVILRNRRIVDEIASWNHHVGPRFVNIKGVDGKWYMAYRSE